VKDLIRKILKEQEDDFEWAKEIINAPIKYELYL